MSPTVATSQDAPSSTSGANPTRRSISIFSRRGVEASESTPPFHEQGGLRVAPRSRVEKQTARPSRDLGSSRRSSKIAKDSDGKSPKSPKTPRGTVLNAVPPAKTIRMNQLEEDMATLPNQEILSTIGEHNVSAYGSHSQQNSPSRHCSTVSRRASSVATRTHSTKRRETNNRIGVWVDGVVHWDPERRPVSKSWEQKIEEETGLAPLRPPLTSAKDASLGRPRLSVTIPQMKPLKNVSSRQTIHFQPVAQKSVRPIAPATAVSKFAIPAPPAKPAGESKEVSPVSSASTPPIPPRAASRPGSSSTARERVSHASSSTDESVSDEDDASDYSKNSSATSVEMASASSEIPTKTDARPVSALSLSDSRKAGVIDDSSNGVGDTNKPLPPIPTVMARRSLTVAPLSSSSSSSSKRPTSSKSVKSLPDRSVRVSRSMNQLDLCDQEFMRSSPYSLEVPDKPSPTLSQAENELQHQLSTLSKPETKTETKSRAAGKKSSRKSRSEARASRISLVSRSSSVHSVMHPPETAPAVPIRSRKRDWCLPPRSKGTNEADRPPRPRSELHLKTSEPIIALQRSASMQVAGPTTSLDERTPAPVVETEQKADVPDITVEDTSSDDFTDANESIADDSAQSMSASAAEDVLLHILSTLKTTEDLFNTAIINKGMYRVYKENEMQLLRCVTYTESPALWELREWCPPQRNNIRSSKDSSVLEHTPLTYMRCYRRDVAVVESLKKLILEKCQTVIRRETASALSSPAHPEAPRFNDAFWRIWCFCKAFGSNKGREDDITGQLDWLKGGLLAHNQGCVATVNTNLDFDMSSVLLNAPEYFAEGNADGLSADQLFDVTEIWTCLATLLQSYQGRVDVARSSGIYEHCEVEPDDIEKEEQILEEWTAYILTLGPAVVLEMAELASDPGTAGFELAKQNGWTTWAEPIYSGSRHNFLKEPVARLYQERVNEEQELRRDPHAQEKKEQSRQRVANLAQEIRLRRQSSSYKRLPLIDMANERPMSMFSHAASVRSTRSSASTVSRPPPLPRSPTSATESSRIISPIAEDGSETAYNPSQFNSFSPGLAHDTSERAVRKVVEMGFTPAQARLALQATDKGNGLRVDKAVDYLIGSQT